jgi:hypothetical protein
MSDERGIEGLIEATREMVEANEAYQAALVTNATLLKRLVERLEHGEDVVEIVRQSPGKPGRAGAKSAEEVLAGARTRFRVALVCACMAGGMSTREIAANMGTSRQLVERYARTARQPR